MILAIGAGGVAVVVGGPAEGVGAPSANPEAEKVEWPGGEYLKRCILANLEELENMDDFKEQVMALLSHCGDIPVKRGSGKETWHLPVVLSDGEEGQ